MKGILGRKIGMTQVFTKEGNLIPVTVVEVTPNVVMQVKTVENDGYSAIQLGVVDKKEKNAELCQIAKCYTQEAERWHFKKGSRKTLLRESFLFFCGLVF